MNVSHTGIPLHSAIPQLGLIFLLKHIDCQMSDYRSACVHLYAHLWYKRIWFQRNVHYRSSSLEG